MILYCISLFLESTKIDNFIKTCECNKIEYKSIEITDQTGETGNGYQANLSGLKVLLLPCNKFHKDKDFEIGITEENHEKWNAFVKNAKETFQNEYGKFEDDDSEYLLVNDKKLHGNFFFIFDGKKSEEAPLLKIECRMKNNDIIFYKDIIAKIIGENLTSKISAKEDDCFAIDKIIVKHNDETITFVI